MIENTLLRIQRSKVSKKVAKTKNASAKKRNKWWIKTEMTVYLIKLANPSLGHAGHGSFFDEFRAMKLTEQFQGAKKSK